MSNGNTFLHRLFLFVGMLASTSLYSQNEKALVLGLTMNAQQLQDLGQSPLIYKGAGLGFNMSHEKRYPKKNIRLNLAYSSMNLKPDEDHSSAFELLNASQRFYGVSYLKEVQLVNGTWSYWAGGKVNTFLEMVDFQNNANNPIGYDLTIAIQPLFSVKYVLNNETHFYLRSNLSLLSYSTRPQALGLFPTSNLEVNVMEVILSGTLGSINKVFSMGTRLEYYSTTRKGLTYALFGSTEITKNSLSEKKGKVQNRIGISLHLHK